MIEKNPDTKLRRVPKWYTGHTCKDGTVLESAKETYDKLKAAEEKRKDDDLNVFELDNDEISEVFRPNTPGIVRVVGYHLSKRKLQHISVADVKVKEKDQAYSKIKQELDKFSSQVNTRMASVGGLIHVMLQEMRKGKQIDVEGIATPTPVIDIGSNSTNRPMHFPPLTRNLDNVFCGMSSSRITNPEVVLVDRANKELARGFVLTEETSKICYGRVMGKGEKKVCIEEVYDRDAPLWDGVQDGHTTLGLYLDGGFLVWLDAWLNYV